MTDPSRAAKVPLSLLASQKTHFSLCVLNLHLFCTKMKGKPFFLHADLMSLLLECTFPVDVPAALGLMKPLLASPHFAHLSIFQFGQVIIPTALIYLANQDSLFVLFVCICTILSGLLSPAL